MIRGSLVESKEIPDMPIDLGLNARQNGEGNGDNRARDYAHD